MIEETAILDLSVLITLQDDGYKDLQEDKVNYEGVAHKVKDCKVEATAAYSGVASI